MHDIYICMCACVWSALSVGGNITADIRLYLSVHIAFTSLSVSEYKSFDSTSYKLLYKKLNTRLIYSGGRLLRNI